METKQILIDSLDGILVDIGIVQDMIDKNKVNLVTNGDKLKVGACISKKMALEIEFKTVCKILKGVFEADLATELSVEQNAKLESLKVSSLDSMVSIEDGKVKFTDEVQKVINGSK